MSAGISFPYQLYLVISQADCGNKNMLEVAEQAINGGVDIIQLREKKMPDADFLQLALQLKQLTDRYTIPLIINDRVAIARQVNAIGVHVGNNDWSPQQIRQQYPGIPVIGYSVEYLWQVNNIHAMAADYLGISPVFKTDTKTDTVTEWGLEGISKIRNLTNKPLVAIGNMNSANAKSVMKAGADCIAVVSAICGSADPQKAAAALKNEINS